MSTLPSCRCIYSSVIIIAKIFVITDNPDNTTSIMTASSTIMITTANWLQI